MTTLNVPDNTMIDLRARDLGRMPYGEALELQRRLQQEVIAARAAAESNGPHVMHVLLVEHDPAVITISRRQGARQHLIATAAQLETAGVEVAETDRGGDITYHGPGQLVVYPILDLNVLGLRLHGYMRFLEQIVIDLLGQYNIAGARDETATGVWVETGDEQLPRSAKICAMGVRVSRWVSMHGLALNVATNLQHFQLIVPCGLADRPVTSMQQLLLEQCPTMDDVKQNMVERFRSALQKR